METVPPAQEQTQLPSNGPIVAAFVSATIGILVLALVQVATVMSASFKDTVFEVGKAWIPGAEGIGPSSGKETFMLAAWLLSWVGLHYTLRQRELPLRPLFGVALAILAVAVFLVWPPVWHLIE